MIRRMVFWGFALGGWILAAYFFNTPTGNPHFTDSAPYINSFEPGGQKVVEWHDGKYELFSTGAERVTPYLGPLTLAFDPGRGNCPQSITIGETGIAFVYCYEGKIGGAWRKDLPSRVEWVLRRGRTLAEQHWGPLTRKSRL